MVLDPMNCPSNKISITQLSTSGLPLEQTIFLYVVIFIYDVTNFRNFLELPPTRFAHAPI